MIKKAFFLLSFLFAFFPLLIVSGQTLNLDEALVAMGGVEKAELRWDPFFASGRIINGRHEAAFSAGRAGESGMVLMNHRELLELPLPYLAGGALIFPETFVNQVASTFHRFIEEDKSRYRIAAIVIDPGHGGRDPGASFEHTVNGRTFRSVEKDIVLQVSLQLHALLSARYPDRQILLTRNDDSFLSLEARVDMANSIPLGRNEVVIFVSVHANASFNRNARGFEVWYLSPGYRRNLIDPSRFTGSPEVLPILNSMLEEELTIESILLANSILHRMGETVGHLSPCRGLKAAEWFVVRNARMPSVLVELGFVSNETDALLMNDDAYLMKLSQALYKGISDFVAFFERSGGFTAFQ